VVVVDDAIQADDLASHLKAGDLITAVFGGQAGLEEASTDGVERSEFLAVGEQSGTTLDFAACGHQIIEAIDVVFRESHRHAQFTQIAVRTGDFDGLGIHIGDFHCCRSCLGSTSYWTPKIRVSTNSGFYRGNLKPELTWVKTPKGISRHSAGYV